MGSHRTVEAHPLVCALTWPSFPRWCPVPQAQPGFPCLHLGTSAFGQVVLSKVKCFSLCFPSQNCIHVLRSFQMPTPNNKTPFVSLQCPAYTLNKIQPMFVKMHKQMDDLLLSLMGGTEIERIGKNHPGFICFPRNVGHFWRKEEISKIERKMTWKEMTQKTISGILFNPTYLSNGQRIWFGDTVLRFRLLQVNRIFSLSFESKIPEKRWSTRRGGTSHTSDNITWKWGKRHKVVTTWLLREKLRSLLEES